MRHLTLACVVIVLVGLGALGAVVRSAAASGSGSTIVAGGTVSPANGTVFPPGTRTVPYAWKLDLPADCNLDLPWRNGILGTGLFIGPPGSTFADGKPHQGLFGRDAADDSKLEASGHALLLAPGPYTVYASGSCVSKTSGAPRIEFETPRSTFMVKAKLSTVAVKSRLTIDELTTRGIELHLSCGANCLRASFVAALTPSGAALGTVTATAPGGKQVPFMPMPTMPKLFVKLSPAAKAKVASLKVANVQIKAIVKLADGETQVVASKAAFIR